MSSLSRQAGGDIVYNKKSVVEDTVEGIMVTIYVEHERLRPA